MIALEFVMDCGSFTGHGGYMIVLALLLVGGWNIAGVFLYFEQYCNKWGPVNA